jgi:hypothetical protein
MEGFLLLWLIPSIEGIRARKWGDLCDEVSVLPRVLWTFRIVSKTLCEMNLRPVSLRLERSVAFAAVSTRYSGTKPRILLVWHAAYKTSFPTQAREYQSHFRHWQARFYGIHVVRTHSKARGLFCCCQGEEAPRLIVDVVREYETYVPAPPTLSWIKTRTAPRLKRAQAEFTSRANARGTNGATLSRSGCGWTAFSSWIVARAGPWRSPRHNPVHPSPGHTTHLTYLRPTPDSPRQRYCCRSHQNRERTSRADSALVYRRTCQQQTLDLR